MTIRHNQWMRGRGLLILLATLVVLMSGLSSLRHSPTATPAPKPATPTGTPTPPLPPITATMPADGLVRLKPGQTLHLQIKSDSPDIALISELGLKLPVGPDVPGDVVLVAPASGSFAVTLEIARRSVGEIVVGG